jgi:hypothetical protein
MKKVLITAILTSTIMSASNSLEVLSIDNIDASELQNNIMITSNEVKQIEYKEVKIKDGGIEQTIRIEVKKDNNSSIGTQSSTIDKLNSSVGLLIYFKDLHLSIEEFEKLFNLKLQEKLHSGYYIFENKSGLSDIELIDIILKSDIKEHLKTIRPNWKMDVVEL